MEIIIYDIMFVVFCQILIIVFTIMIIIKFINQRSEKKIKIKQVICVGPMHSRNVNYRFYDKNNQYLFCYCFS